MFADTADTIQSVDRAIRKPIGWIAPSKWIGSRSQFVKSTLKSASLMDAAP
ncbi:hypothetical protein [Sphingomonas rhizophila]|uniref:hypothetical protein n=1 Tax=Sphingomonas rhizophila TaxID=2071607 RepID=UPI0031B5D475